MRSKNLARYGILHLQVALLLSQLAVQLLSLLHCGTELCQNVPGLVWAKHAAQQVALHLQQAQTLL